MSQDIAMGLPQFGRKATAAGARIAERSVVLVLNHDGLPHLQAGLASMLALEGLAGPEALVVADNGSRDGSLDWLAREHPDVTTIAFPENLGFAGGNNAAIAQIQADWILLLNNDTRIAPGALFCLAEAAAASKAACLAARILSWDGERMDFDGGAASFTGHGHALGYGDRVGRSWLRGPDPHDMLRPTLFACGAAMLIKRQVFLDLGGFGADYFAYYEDLDLGWRLWLSGERVLHVPSAQVWHRHHGSEAALATGARLRLMERNALATVVRNYGDASLERVLPAALALAASRARIASRADSEGLGPAEMCDLIDGAMPPDLRGLEDLPLPPADWSGWADLEDLALDWPAMAQARKDVQRLRQVEDSALLPRLGTPYAPVPASPMGRDVMRRVIDRFELEAIFGPAPVWLAGGPLRSALARIRSGLGGRGAPVGRW